MRGSSLKLADSKFLRYLKSYIFLQGKHVGFYGNFGHGDLGDDAAFWVAQKLLGDDLLPFSKRCYAFHPRVLKALLIGGGGILRWECPYIPRKLLEKDQWHFPVILFSAGVNCDWGKEFTRESLDEIKKLCDLSCYLTVRDEYTREFLHHLGYVDVHILPDLELFLEESRRDIGYEKKGKTIGIVLSSHSEFNKDTMRDIIQSFVEFTQYLTQEGYHVIFLPFENHLSENKNEKIMFSEIKQRLGNKERVTFLPNNFSPQEILYVIKEYCDMMVCMRLHGAVFAANAGVPFVCIAFNQMHQGFFKMLQWEEGAICSLNDLSSWKLKQHLRYLIDHYDDLKTQLIKRTGILRWDIQQEIEKIKQNFIPRTPACRLPADRENPAFSGDECEKI